MFACQAQHATEIDDMWTIQSQPRDGRPPDGRAAFDSFKLRIPMKVFVPVLRSRIEERHCTTADGVDRFRDIELVIIAALTREREVRILISASH